MAETWGKVAVQIMATAQKAWRRKETIFETARVSGCGLYEILRREETEKKKRKKEN